jgi:CheY-like chemotaxis protein
MVNIVMLDDEIFSTQGGDEDETYELWESDLEGNLHDDFKLYIYDSYEKALSKIKELGNNTIVILDMKMPEIDGSDFLKLIRDENFTIPVIAYTGNNIEESTIVELLNNDSLSKKEILKILKKEDYLSNEEKKLNLLKNDIFSYVKRGDVDKSKLIDSINKAIDKFKDNIPLELTEALNEYLERHPEIKDSKILVSEPDGNKELSFSAIQEEINKGTTFGKDYQKALYKIAFEDLKKQKKAIK